MSDLDEVFTILEEICEIVSEDVPYAEKSAIDDELQTNNAHTLNNDAKWKPQDKTSRDPQTANDYSITNQTSSNYFTTIDGQSTDVDSSVSELPSTVFDKESSNDESGASTNDDAQYSTTEEESLKTEDASSDVVDKAPVQQTSKAAVQDDDVAAADEEQEQKGSCTTIVKEPPLDWPGENEKKPTPDASESIVNDAEEKSAVENDDEDLTKEENRDDEWPVEPELNSEKPDPNCKEHPASALSTRDPFLDEINELFEQMQRKKFCFDAMNAIAKRGAELLQLEAAAGLRMFTISSEMMRIAADRLQMAVAEVDIRVCTNYLNVFHSLFLLNKDFKQVMQYVFSLHFKADGSATSVAANNNGEKALPHLHNYFTSYETAYTDVLRDISQQKTNFEELTITTRRLAFLLTISPRATLRRLVIDQVTKKRSFNIVNLSRVIRNIPTLFELRLPNQGLPGKPCSVMVALIYRFWFTFTRSERNGNDVPDINFADKDQCHRMITLLSIFTTTRLYRASGNVLKPLFDPNELVVDFILPQLSPGTSHTALSLKFALDLLDQLLRRRDGHQTSDESIIRWKGETQICGESAVDFGILVGYVADNAVSNQFGGEITQKCFKLIRRLIDIAEAKVMRNKPENGHAREPVIMRIDLTKSTGSSQANQFIPDINRSPPFFKTKRAFHTGNNESRLSDRRTMHRNSDNDNSSQHSQPFRHSNQGSAGYQQHQRPAPMLENRRSAMRILQDTTNHTIINMPATERFQSADQAAAVAKRRLPPSSHNDGDTSSQPSGYGEIPANLFMAGTSTHNSQSSGYFGRHSKLKNRCHNKRFSDANETPIANENSLFSGLNNNEDDRQRNRIDSRVSFPLYCNNQS